MIKDIHNERPFIFFKMLFDEDGNPDLNRAYMGYAGSGKIYYNYMALFHEYNDELLFHEFFHIFQNTDMSPKKAYITKWKPILLNIFMPKVKGIHNVRDLLITNSLKKL